MKIGPGRILRFLTPSNHAIRGAFIGAVVSTAVAAVTVAAFVISNIVTIGPIQVGFPVTLTKVKDLPSSASIGAKNEVEFTVEASESVANATLWFELKAEQKALTDGSIVEVLYRTSEDSTRRPVTMAPSNGTLRGMLTSGWNIAAGYSGTGKVEVTFAASAPSASYSANIWLDGNVGTAVPSGTATSSPTATATTQSGPRAFALRALRDGFSGVSGSGSDGASIAGTTNPTMKVKAGETAQVTVEFGDSLHNLAVYASSCPNGSCAGSVARSANVSSSSPQAVITFSRPTAGATLDYYCDYHPDSMRGLIEITQ